MNEPIITADYPALCEYAADRIAALIREKPDAVLGLATGATPLGVYASLVRRVEGDELDFSRVTTFNLDEYYPMPPESPRSYHSFMQAQLFRHIPCRRWFVPDGRPHPPDQIAAVCRAYEAKIADAGGIDLQLLGIGRTGHIGFNEPGSALSSRTRLVTLAPLTRRDAAPSFGGIDAVPREAITMGIGNHSGSPASFAAGKRRGQGRDCPHSLDRRCHRGAARVALGGAPRFDGLFGRRRRCAAAVAGPPTARRLRPRW